ncbi:MAG: hypothetical protein L0Z54_04770, partial [Thermoplasmata archaeon]|nr:hypothetical protein [Thermoplasmata archaeon]
LENLRTETAVSTLPVVRPLVAMDKEDIIRIARRIGTFGLSTLPGNCCMMAPERPSTMAHADRVAEEEAHLDLDALVSAALAGREEHVLDPEPM